MRGEAWLFDRLIPAVYRAAGRPQFRLLAELRARERWTVDRLTAHRWAALRRLVAHAYERVPYYRDLFRRVGATPADLRGFDDYARLPVLTREIVRDHLPELVARGWERRLLANTTGGSTGMPLRFYQTRAFLDVTSAAWFRGYLWTGLPLGCRKFYVWGHPSETGAARRWKGRLEHWLHRRVFLDAFDVSPARVEAWARTLAAHRPEFGYGYASALEAFATLARARGLDAGLRGVRAIMSTAERLTPTQRELLESTFGCRVFDQYGSREIWSIASECAAGSMHVNADLHHVEHVREEGAPAASLVVTPLDNYGMPMLRYRNDDLADPVEGPCACGLPLPRMTPVLGRTSDNFRTPDGRIVHGEYLTHLLYGVDGVDRFQFLQTALDRVTLSIVKGPRFCEATERALARAADEFRGYFGFPLTIAYVERIAPTASGKARFTISRVTA